MKSFVALDFAMFRLTKSHFTALKSMRKNAQNAVLARKSVNSTFPCTKSRTALIASVAATAKPLARTGRFVEKQEIVYKPSSGVATGAVGNDYLAFASPRP